MTVASVVVPVEMEKAFRRVDVFSFKTGLLGGCFLAYFGLSLMRYRP